MKGKRLALILVGLSLVLTSVLPNVKQVESNPTSQVSSTEKPLRKIAFIARDDNETWLINEDGSGLQRTIYVPLSDRRVERIKWSPDGRWLGFSSSSLAYPYIAGIVSESGSDGLELSGSFVGWVPDSSAFVTSGKVYSSPQDKVGRQAFSFVKAKHTVKILEALERDVYYEGWAEFSPRYKYFITSQETSPPVDLGGYSDQFTHNIQLRDTQTGEFLAELSKRAFLGVFWSDKEDKVAFYERDEDTLKEQLTIYSLSDDLTLKITDSWTSNPVLFLPDGKRLLYLHRTGYETSGATLPPGMTLLNLETGEKEELPGVSISYPSEGIPRENIKLAEAGTKLIYNTTEGDDLSSGGIFVYDFETKNLKQIVRGWIWPGTWDVVGNSVVYALAESLIITDLSGENSRVLVKRPPPPIYSVGFREVSIQPQIPPEKFKNRKVLVLAQGIGSEVKEGYPRNVFPEYWPIIDEAMAREIYQDVIVYSYPGGKMENGKWVPTIGHPEASFQSIKNSALVFSRTLSTYATAHPGATFDIVGHSLGGKVAWEYLETFVIGKKIPSEFYRIGRLVTLGSPLNGRHRDLFFQTIGQLADELVRSTASDELNNEALLWPHQVITEEENIKSYALAAGDEILIYNLASEDDCIVPQQGRFPYNSALINGFGYLYRGLDRGTNGIRFADCKFIEYNLLDLGRIVEVDLADVVNVIALIQIARESKEKRTETLIKAAGHDRYFTNPRVRLDLRDLIIYDRKPRRMDED